MKKLAIWLLILLGFSPLFVATRTISPMADGKVFMYRAIAFVVTALLFITITLGKEKEVVLARIKVIYKTPIFLAMTASAVILALSTVFAYDTFTAFFGEPTRGEGFLTIFSLYMLYVGMVSFFDRAEWKYFFSTLSVSGIAVFIYSVVQLAQDVDRPYSTVGNPIPLSALYLFTFFAGYYLWILKEKKAELLKVLGIFTMILSIVGIFLTKTRGTIVALAAASAVSVIVAAVYNPHVRVVGISIRKAALFAGAMLLAFFILFGVTHNASFWQSVPGLNRFTGASVNSDSIQSRLIYTEITIRGFKENTAVQKLIGWGWDNYALFWQKNYDVKVHQYDRNMADRAHNKLGDMLIMTGIVGLIAYLFLWAGVVKKVRSIAKKQVALALGLVFLGVSYFVHNLFAFDIPVILFSFYTILAFLTTYTYEER